MKRTIPGAHGIGKVTMIFRPKKPTKSIWIKLLTAVFYMLFFAVMFVSFSWSRPTLKHTYVLPFFTAAFKVIDSVKAALSPASKPLVVNEQGFTLIAEQSAADVLYEQGYAHAMERMYQMEVYRRASLGRLSEVFGNRTVYMDRYSRTMGFAELAQRDYEALDEAVKGHLKAYCEGVNAYLSKESPWTLPVDWAFSYGLKAAAFTFRRPSDRNNIFRIAPWTPTDSLSVLRMLLCEQSAGGWEDDLLHLLAGRLDSRTGGHLATLLQPSTYAGERASRWMLPGLGGLVIAVSGAASSTGSALLGQSYDSSAHHKGFWYRNCLRAEDAMDVCGMSFPGVPFVLAGRTSHTSWAVLAADHHEEILTSTSSAADEEVVEDIFVYGHEEPLQLTRRSTGGAREVTDLLPAHLTHLLGGDIVLLKSSFLSTALDLGALLSLNQDQLPAGEAPGYRLIYSTSSGVIGEVGVEGTAEVIVAGEPVLLSAAQHPAGGGACSALCELLRSPTITPQEVAAVLEDTYSPTGHRLAALLAAHTSAPADDLRAWDGRYAAGSEVAQLVEGVRTYLLQHLYTLASNSSKADHYFYSLLTSNITAIPRLSARSLRTEGLLTLLEASTSSTLKTVLEAAIAHASAPNMWNEHVHSHPLAPLSPLLDELLAHRSEAKGGPDSCYQADSAFRMVADMSKESSQAVVAHGVGLQAASNAGKVGEL